MTIEFKNQALASQMASAMASGDEDAMALAWGAFADGIAERVRADYASDRASRDAGALAARGCRALTGAETRFYERLATALKAPRVTNQSFIDILGSDDVDDIMPETIVEDVMRYLAEEHPLLKAVDVQYVGYATKWVINDNSTQKGGWGKIDAKITDEIEGGLKVIDLTQCKYSAFCTVPIDILDMGPAYLDSFVRATLAEAIAYGMEDAIVNGTGESMPIGVTRNPNTYSSDTGYEEKTAVAVTSFEPEEYGALVAQVAKTEAGRTRVFDKVQLICNTTDYLTKIMPATTVLTATGEYAGGLFPFPTEVIPSVAVAEGTAVLGLLSDYTLAVGGSKNGVIEYDDSIGFLDHTRTFRVVQHAAGRAYDDTSFVVLDVSALEPGYIYVKTVEETVTA